MATRSEPLPRAATVRGNDWRAITVPPLGGFVPRLPLSVVVPYFEAPGPLALTLAALERQTYPRDLFEVVVADDGSAQPPYLPPLPFAIRTVRQERRGFGLARARNNGARAAAHDILVFLDCDVLPEDCAIAAHARWHHAVADALTLGFCSYVAVDGVDAAAVRTRRGTLRELFAGRPFDPPWQERRMVLTDDLVIRRDDAFRAVAGNNLGIRRAFFESVGGFDESFDRYGWEDTEFGFRVQNRSGVLVPARDAAGWHQGRFAANDCPWKRRAVAAQRAHVADRIPHPDFRPPVRGAGYAVPRTVVTLRAARAHPDRTADTAGRLLAGADPDLAVCIETDPDGSIERTLLERFQGDRRVRIAPAQAALDRFPNAAFHVSLPAGADVTHDLLPRVHDALRDACAGVVVLPDGAEATMAHAWALHRARRTGGRPADFGDTARIVCRKRPYKKRLRLPRPVLVRRPVQGMARVIGELRRVRDRGDARRILGWLAEGLRWRLAARRVRPATNRDRPHASRRGRPRMSLRAGIVQALGQAAHVRGVRTGWRYLRWLGRRVRWTILARGIADGTPLPPQRSARSTEQPRPAAAGVVLAACGARARAVFAATGVPLDAPPDRADVVVADTQNAVPAADTPVVVLADVPPALAVPAFEPAGYNPVGWVANVENRVVALGPRRLLPPGVRARGAAQPVARAPRRHLHHFEDVAAFHAGPVERAGVLVRLAATGTPVHLADRDPALAGLLGAELHDLMTRDFPLGDLDLREAFSIGQRRLALRDHTVTARVRQLCEAAGAEPPPPPLVSVLLATRRPELLAHAVRSVAKQSYEPLELVLALHGDDFDEASIARVAPELRIRIVRVSADRPLGTVLDAATAAAGGELLAKMDDDDCYDTHHIGDLVLARAYSGAALVGKGNETAYLASADLTVRRGRWRNETFSTNIAGGGLLIGSSDLARAGGWRPIPRGVDQTLVRDVLRAGGTAYRTHGSGFLLVRHGGAHTWDADERRLLADADDVHRGWQPELAGIGDVPRCPCAGPRGPVRS